MRLLNESLDLIKQSFKIWSEKNPYLIGGAIAFYIIFSIAPLLVMILIIAGFVFGKNAAEGQIVKEFNKVLGMESAQMIQDIIQKASTPPTRVITSIISVPMVVLGSSMVFYQIRHALNYLWELDESRTGMEKVAKDYFLSFLMVIVSGGIVLLLVIKTPLLYLLRDYLETIIPFPAKYITIIDVIVTFFIMMLLLGIMYKLLPQVNIEWKDVWVGAALTSFLFTAATLLINLYIKSTGVDSAYGAIGAGTILLIWIYYSSLAFLLGASFTKVYSSRHGAEKGWETEKNN